MKRTALLAVLFAACAPVAMAQSTPDVTILVGAKKVPPPAPGGPPPARPAQSTPESYYQPVGPFFFYVETLTSGNPTKYGVVSTTPCVQTGVFKRGMRLVFRFEVLDTATGKRVTDRDKASLKVRLPHGEEVSARWAVRGAAGALPDSAWMWDAFWDIPPDYPIGALDYAILVATEDGRKVAFTPPIQKTARSDTRIRIID